MEGRPFNTIPVTQPDLPPLSELLPCLESIWLSRVLTNGGNYHQLFEQALASYLNVPFISLFSNGTLALIAALRSLNLRGEVITTPFTFVASTHAISLSGLVPVFVDIEPRTLNLDPRKIEGAITERTTAILPVHAYGYPCDVEAIDSLAKRYKLKVIYDAAHAFGVKCHCKESVLNHGDLSALSFHATKVFNTFEGGAVVCRDEEMKLRLDRLKNFGFINETSIESLGFNGKMNEFCAALGLLQLKHVDAYIKARREKWIAYRNSLEGVVGITLHPTPTHEQSNYAYFPIFVEDNYRLTRDELYDQLKKNGILVRRYFYPLTSKTDPYVNKNSALEKDIPVAEDRAGRVICLPIYSDLPLCEIIRIVNMIKGS